MTNATHVTSRKVPSRNVERARRARSIPASSIALALTLAFAARPASAAAHPPGLSLAYDVYYLAFRILAVESTTFVAPDGYRTNTFMQTTGFLGALFPWEARSSAFGSIVGAQLVPGQYELRSVFRGKPIAVDLRYGEDGEVSERIEGVDFAEGRRVPVPEDEQSNTLDPLTAAISLSHELERTGKCAGIRRVYDGVRRYDLHYEDLGTADLEKSDEGYGGPTRLCKASVQPIGGFITAGEGAGEAPQAILAWLAPPMPGAAPVPLRLDMSSSRGTLSAYLQKAETKPAAAEAVAPTAAVRTGD
jgi:hypothetical protein